MEKNEEREEIIRKAVETYGKEKQLVMVMEECSELQKECSKAFRGEVNKNNLAEEMADVLLMIRQLQIMYHIGSTELNMNIDKKLYRLKTKMEDYNK